MKKNIVRKIMIVVLIGIIALLGVGTSSNSDSLIIENGNSIQVVPKASAIQANSMNVMPNE